jgi:hypothetical protein
LVISQACFDFSFAGGILRQLIKFYSGITPAAYLGEVNIVLSDFIAGQEDFFPID